jgi:hypothetical protein
MYRRDKQHCWEVCGPIWLWHVPRKLSVSGRVFYKFRVVLLTRNGSMESLGANFVSLCIQGLLRSIVIKSSCNFRRCFLCGLINPGTDPVVSSIFEVFTGIKSRHENSVNSCCLTVTFSGASSLKVKTYFLHVIRNGSFMEPSLCFCSCLLTSKSTDGFSWNC